MELVEIEDSRIFVFRSSDSLEGQFIRILVHCNP